MSLLRPGCDSRALEQACAHKVAEACFELAADYGDASGALVQDARKAARWLKAGCALDGDGAGCEWLSR